MPCCLDTPLSGAAVPSGLTPAVAKHPRSVSFPYVKAG
jgi:hypothetical protein